MAPAHLRDDLAEEDTALAYLSDQTEHGMIGRAAKYSSMDAAYKSAKRGRNRPPSSGPN